MILDGVNNTERMKKMKKIFKLCLALALSFSFFLQIGNDKVNAATEQGDGSKENPYIISNVSDLALIDQSDSYIYAKLSNDLDLSESIPEGEYYLTNFYGELDGANYKIKNIPSGKAFISRFNGGELKNFTWDLNVDTSNTEGYTYLVLEQVNLSNQHNYTNINVTGNMSVGSNNNNESPLVVYGDGNTTMTNVNIALNNYESPTYNGLFIGYEPSKDSTYKFINCSVSGTYFGKDLGILFGNGSCAMNSNYGLQHAVGGINGYGKTTDIIVENLDLTDATILGMDSVPHLVCGVSYSDAFDALENTLKEKTTGYVNMKKTASLDGYVVRVNEQGQLMIDVANENSNIGSFKVISEIYSNVFTLGSSNGTIKSSVSETIDVVKGSTKYYSTLGKVKFYDGTNGTYGTTGVDGKLETITVDGNTYYTLLNAPENNVYTFGNEAKPSNTSKVSSVRVLVYDTDGKLMNAISGITSEQFEVPSIESVKADAGVKLSDVSLTDGWKWTNLDKKVVVGSQIAFAVKDNIVAPITIVGEEVYATGVALNTQTLNLDLGSSSQLTAVITPENTTNKGLSWSSSNEKIVTVDQSGKVTAVGEGSAVITVSTSNGKKATCTVTVNPVTQITVETPAIDTTNKDEVQVGLTSGDQTAAQEVIKETVNQIKDVAGNEQTVVNAVSTAVTEGKDITTELTVNKVAEKDVASADVTAVETALSYLQDKAGATSGTVAQYLDINVLVKVDGTTVGELNQLSKEITVSIGIPTELQTEGRQFYVIRVHGDEITRLPLTKNADGTYSFKTDRFSTYALVYVDGATESYLTGNESIAIKPVTTPPTSGNTETTKPNTETPETSAAMFGGMFATMAVLSAGIAVVLWKKRELSK